MKLERVLLALALGLALPFVLVSVVSAQVRHVVSSGDTLSYLAQVYVVTIDEIAEINGIANPNLIVLGQELLIPGGGSSNSASIAPDGEIYTVNPGDTLSGIASRFGVSVDDIVARNGINDRNLIVSGQTLKIPGVTASAEVAPAEVPRLAFPGRPHNPEAEALMEEIAASYGVSAGLVKAIATVESGWNQGAISHAGAVGAMQIMPGTAEWLETSVFGISLNEDTSLYDNVKMGAAFLRILLDATGGHEGHAVAAYYQGLTPTQAGVFYPDTQDYVRTVMAVRATYWP